MLMLSAIILLLNLMYIAMHCVTNIFIDDDSKQKYVTSLVDEESSNLLQSFLENVDNNDVSIDELTTQLTGIILSRA